MSEALASMREILSSIGAYKGANTPSIVLDRLRCSGIRGQIYQGPVTTALGQSQVDRQMLESRTSLPDTCRLPTRSLGGSACS